MEIVLNPNKLKGNLKYLEDFINKIIKGDSLELIKPIPDGSIDIVLTDPPYGLNKNGIRGDADLRLFYNILPECYRVLKNDSFFITFFSTKFLPQLFKNNPFNYFWQIVLYCPEVRVKSPIGYTKFMSCFIFKKGSPKIIHWNKNIFIDTTGKMVEPDEGNKTMNIPAKIFVRNRKLIIELPLTNPTGKIRVKRRSKTSKYGLPIATRRDTFVEEDYVEWQIFYATQNPPPESKVDDIVINNNQIGFELTKLLVEGVKLGIFSNGEVFELEEFISNVQSTETLEENEKIFRENNEQEIKGGFKRFVERVPIFIKKNEEMGYLVEIILRHKQRAVGLQAMVYLCIYIGILKDKNGNSFIGRTAETREFGQLEVTQENKTIVADVVKAFAIASWKHKNDILNILGQIKRKCKL